MGRAADGTTDKRMPDMTILFDNYNALLKPAKLWQHEEVISGAAPKSSGVYAWYFQNIPAIVPTTNCTMCEGLPLLYIGTAPKTSVSKDTLHKRLRNHYSSNAYGSTLRLSLGCLLSNELGIQLRRVGESRMTFAQGEKRLSEWLAANAFVVWITTAEPWVVERELIETISPPLNLEYNRKHPFYPALSEIRKSAKQRAKLLPILRG